MLRRVETYSPEEGIVSNRLIAYDGEYQIETVQIAHHWFRVSVFKIHEKPDEVCSPA